MSIQYISLINRHWKGSKSLPEMEIRDYLQYIWLNNNVELYMLNNLFILNLFWKTLNMKTSIDWTNSNVQLKSNSVQLTEVKFCSNFSMIFLKLTLINFYNQINCTLILFFPYTWFIFCKSLTYCLTLYKVNSKLLLYS